MSKDSPTTFMTGVTGFLGRFVLRDLLVRGRRVVAVLREPLDRSRRRFSANMKDLGIDAARFVDEGRLALVEGSLPDNLPGCTWGQPNDIISCAASLQLFSNGNEEPYRTNVAGTEQLLRWARDHGVNRVHAVSTAYVCGWHTERAREVFHHPQPRFQTEYERSKWLAEALWAEWAAEPGNILTVYRPSLLVGDSSTGYTSQFGGFYQFARMVSILKEQYRDGSNGSSTYIPLRIPGRPDDPQNFVPVDFVSRIIAEVVLNEALQGRIYHLTDPSPITNGEIKSYVEDYFKMHGGYFAEPEKVINHCTTAESLLWEKYDVLTPRVTNVLQFDQANTQRVMRAAGVSFPSIDRRRFSTLLDYAISQRWGQRSNGNSSGGR